MLIRNLVKVRSILAAKSTDVRDVLVNGKLTKADKAKIMAKGREVAQRVKKSIR